MRIYVAGKWEDRENVQYIQRELVRLGYEITKDWTIDEESAPGYPVINVVEDIGGVQRADIYIGVFMADHQYKGALVELGAALALRKACYILGDGIDSCIFIKHPLVKQFATLGELILAI